MPVAFTALSQDAIARALFENYEVIYIIDAGNGVYECYHQIEAYRELQIASSGEDFFGALSSTIPMLIHPEDQEYVLHMLRREAMLDALRQEKYYSIVYRLLIDGRPTYHKLRATLDIIDGREYILLGVRNVDETIRQEKLHSDALASLFQKEKNHMEAILGSAAGYLEVNLTKDLVLEQSPYLPSGSADTASETPVEELSSYSRMNRWLCRNQIVENVEKYRQISSRSYLLSCFEKGERRASVSFSAKIHDGEEQPCREVFYLYRDHASGDLMSFCVIYDLTEQQRREKEMQELETALQMSRIRNFTSQMQPHFLYNALGSIQEIVLEDPQYASELIGDFTTHLRSCIRAMASDTPLPFSQELENIRAYVNIEKMRFGDKLKVIYNITAEDFAILPLSIQPLVENAIRHGIYGRGPQGGTVTIRTRGESKAWVIEIEDDGIGFDVNGFLNGQLPWKTDATGLKNLIFRLDKVMGARVKIASAVGKGTKVKVLVPKGEL